MNTTSGVFIPKQKTNGKEIGRAERWSCGKIEKNCLHRNALPINQKHSTK